MAVKGSKTKKCKSAAEKAKQRWRTAAHKIKKIRFALKFCKSDSHKKKLEDRMRFWQTAKVA